MRCNTFRRSFSLDDRDILEFRENRDSKETVALSGTVIKVCEALHSFNIKISSVEKRIRAELPRRKKETSRQIGLIKFVH